MKPTSPTAPWRILKLAPLAVLLAVASGCGQNPVAPEIPSSGAMVQTTVTNNDGILPNEEPAGPADPGSIGGTGDSGGVPKVISGSGGAHPQKKPKKPKNPKGNNGNHWGN